MMMAEGQGNGNDSPERDGAWQPVPGADGSTGDGPPETDTEPGAPDAAEPGTSWLPFRMTSPADEASQPASTEPVPGTPPPPGAPPVPRTPPAAGSQPVSGEHAVPGAPAGPGAPAAPWPAGSAPPPGSGGLATTPGR